MPVKAKPFAERVFPVPESGCHLFDGAWTKQGYGAIKINGRMISAHRVAWELENGPIPDGLDALHKCDTPACVNPAHIFIGTHAENMRDKYRKGRARHTRGEGHGPTKLTEAQVRAIRVDPRSPYLACRDYGVSPKAVYDIRSGKNWGWLQ
jgi:hypothetical protein